MSTLHAAHPETSRRWTALGLLCLAQFMLIVDITVVQVALPSIGDDLDLGREALTWVVTGYTLFFGGLMILGGRLADVFGARRTLLAGLALFTLASLACGLAGTGSVLVAGRAAQGVGTALLSPAALAIITTTFHDTERHRAFGVWAAIGGAGAAVGVLLSGVLTAGPGWEWVFFINVPVGLLVFLAFPLTVPANRLGPQRHRLDVPGALVATTATALLIYGLVRAGDAGWAAAATVLPVTAAAICYAGFIVIERRVGAPVVSPELLARRPVLSGAFVMLTATGLMLGLFFLTSLYLQQILGLSALRTGLLFLPVAVAITVGAQLGGNLIGRLGGRPVAAAGFLLTAVGAGMLTQISPLEGPYTSVLPGFLVAAFGIGPLFVAATSTTLANVSHHEAGVTSGLINTFHELGGSIGVAVVSTVAAGSIAAGATGIDGFTSGFTMCAVAAGVAGVVALGLVPPGKPAAVVGHGH
ncbi:MAG: MFS transporter [Pseudonocardiaceae bacterium]